MKNNNLTSFKDYLDEEYGMVSTKSKNDYKKGLEAFKLLGVLLQDLRSKKGITKEELANRYGTNKSYIVEN